MAINYFSVKNDLEENNWILLSNEYKNLKTPLKMRCPAGHESEQTYDDWRKHKRCDKCVAGDPYKIKGKVPNKDNRYRVLALDAATNLSGYAIYDDKELVFYGVYKTDANCNTTERINQVKHWLENIIKEIKPDFVIIENIQLQRFGNNEYQVELYRALANLQGVLVDTLFENKLPFSLVYSSEWRKVVGVEGSGRENKKQEAQHKVKSWYGINCTQDEADAICIGKYCVLKNKKIGSWGEKL